MKEGDAVVEKLYTVSLPYEKIVLLDGKVDEETQMIIDLAKTEKSFGLDSYSNEILRQALECGKLSWGIVSISRCEHCDDKPKGYARYDRNSRYHRKGDFNYDKPYSYMGVKPFQGFIIFNGASGICYDCWYKKYLPVIVRYIIDNDLPIELQKNDIAETRYKKDPVMVCYDCGKEMRESEMELRPTVMGDGYYPCGCPHCGAKSLVFGKSHKTTNKFVMKRVEQTGGEAVAPK